MIAAAFAVNSIDPAIVRKVVFSGAMTFVLITSIYAFNAWGGKANDANNLRLNKLSNISLSGFMIISLALLIAAMAIGWVIDVMLIVYIAIIYLLWVLYSYPKIGLKSRPYLGTVLHFVAEVVHFNMIFSVFGQTGKESMLISAYFGLLFAGGHLNHESLDYEPDQQSEIVTGAVKAGQQTTDRSAFILFFVAWIYWLALWIANIAGLASLVIFTLAWVMHAGIYLFYFRKIERSINARLNYRKFYRAIYALAGIALVVYRCFEII